MNNLKNQVTFLKQQLIITFPQLVSLNIKEYNNIPQTDNRNIIIYDMSNACPKKPITNANTFDDTNANANANTNANSNTFDDTNKYFIGSHDFNTFIVKLPIEGINDEYGEKCQYLLELNLYRAIVLKENKIITYDEFIKLPNELSENDKTINWIWFCDINQYGDFDYKLPNKIMSRIESWISLNDDFKFILWTNMEHFGNINNFISELNEKNKQLFFKIKIKYNSDIINLIKKYNDSDKTLINLFSQNDVNMSTKFKNDKFIVSTEHNVNKLKICRLFKTDILRNMILSMNGGIYSDFNDTICLFPLKYFIPLYKNTHFIGTDYSITYSMCRNNYFMYSSCNNDFFMKQTRKCIESAINEFKRLTSNDFFVMYKNLVIDAILFYNKQLGDVLYLFKYINDHSITKFILSNDKYKNIHNILMIVCEMFKYCDENIGIYLCNCVEMLDLCSLDSELNNLPKYKRMRNSRIHNNIPNFVQLKYDFENFSFVDFFLLKYAQTMLVGDLILKTNIAYSANAEDFNLIPYCKSNRLSTISIIMHMYDGTSYGINKKYFEDSKKSVEDPQKFMEKSKEFMDDSRDELINLIV